MAKRREIRNSTAEFLIFQIEGKEQGVEVYYKDNCDLRRFEVTNCDVCSREDASATRGNIRIVEIKNRNMVHT